jgi:hypothetical protein
LTVTLKRKAPTCSATKKDGDPCTRSRVGKDALQRMLDEGFDLVADPESFCAYHARSEAERYSMSVRGGSYSPKRAKAERQQLEQARDPMPRQLAAAAYQLITTLLAARLPGTFPAEVDFRKVALGAYLATAVYDPPQDRAHFIQSILPRGVHNREDAVEVAENELRAVIEELPAEERALAWQMLGTAS